MSSDGSPGTHRYSRAAFLLVVHILTDYSNDTAVIRGIHSKISALTVPLTHEARLTDKNDIDLLTRSYTDHFSQFQMNAIFQSLDD